MKNKTINSKSYEYLLSLVGDNKVIGLEVKNNWLVAELVSGATFRVRNNIKQDATQQNTIQQ